MAPTALYVDSKYDMITRQGEESLSSSVVLWQHFVSDLPCSPFQASYSLPAGAEGGFFISLEGKPCPVPHSILLSLNLPIPITAVCELWGAHSLVVHLPPKHRSNHLIRRGAETKLSHKMKKKAHFGNAFPTLYPLRELLERVQQRLWAQGDWSVCLRRKRLRDLEKFSLEKNNLRGNPLNDEQ